MRIFVIGLMMLGLAGCSFAPDYQRPKMELPQAWKDPGKGEQLDEQWWKRFDDSTLNALVQEALIANRDIAAAVARVDYARAQLGVARAELLPLLSGQAQGTQTWVDNTKITSGSQSPFSAGFGATWELDLWGKLRNAKEAAMYQVLGTEAAQRGMRLSIAAQTSNAYFLLRSLDLQLSTAERTVKTRTDALRIYTARYEQGLISELDLSRAKTEVETAKTALYQTRISRDAAESALEALLGRSPKDIMDGTVQRGMTLESIPTPPVIPAGVPSDLLERRPDIQQAEMSVKSANANIGVAKAAWFPAISLTGLFGVVSPELHTLMSNPLQTWSYGGAASVPLLDFGRVKYGVEAAEAKQRESLATYEKTVQGAFKEMRDALTRQQEMSNVVASLERMVKELRLSVELANTRYDNGYSSYLEVLDAERSLFDSEMQLAAARSERLSSIVNVCLALGGGWK
ncbi:MULTISPECIES: efflux transporter outer membrane subunit [Bilophila]|uniref:efflux transporter outer membrane subunit n=1 Tax=Bilophila TaxID=35832 RepID=UPI0025805DB2|nr:efflux transporter outer membrane subunit [Bilophila sp.]MBS5455796.1 efflux transporter outer membrane subunit [Bilophila sp.]